jgi:predicted lipid-binding transport protein (Tim44 family)
MDSRQQCTQTWGQINICWASAAQGNPVALLNATMMNETYSSMVAAKPSQASYTIALAALQSLTSTTPGVSSSTPAATNSASATPATSSGAATPSGNSNSGGGGGGLSGGAIGGIVGGVVGGLALIGAIAFLLWRRKKYSTVAQADPNSPANGPLNTGYHPGNGYQQNAAEVPANHMGNAPPTEKYANTGYRPSEMPAYQQPAEMSATRY